MRNWNDRGHMGDEGLTSRTQADIDYAYAKGRRDERASRPSHPLLGLVICMVAVAGCAMLFLAAREGSFARGGQVVDTQIAAAGHRQMARQDAQDVTSPDQQRLPQETVGR